MNLTELAKDPQSFDTELARAYGEREKLVARHTANLEAMHRLVGDKQRYQGRTRVWGMDTTQVTDEVIARSCEGDAKARQLLDQRAELSADIDRWADQIDAMDRAYTGWTRFYPSVTKSHPHIHRSMSCHTLHATTVMSWAPELSGHTDAEAVAKLDEALCSVCFPDAPVALHNYVSKRSQAEQAERAAAKADRDNAKAAKQLRPGDQFRTAESNDLVTTVAALKALVTKPVERQVEIDYWTQVAAGTRSAPGWSAEQLARRLHNLQDSRALMLEDADHAEAILLAREAEHEGWGATAEAIAKSQANKLRSARREWGL